MNNKSIGTEPVYDARTLGAPRMFILGLQHMFAMFGATVLVPALSGLDVATTLLFAGLGTLLFHLLTKGKVPAFLGSSFAFIGGYNAVRTIGTNPDGSAIYNNDLLAYACFGVAIAGLMYIILSTLFKVFGVKKVMRYFPPIVTGPIIIAIGLTLSSSAITNCRANWLVAVVAILIVIGFNMWGKGMAKIIPILLGVLGSYIFALIVDPAERASVAAAVSSAKWFGLPIFWKNSVFHLFAGPVDSGVLWSAVLTVVPLSLATMVEHIGDICAISSTCGKNFMVDPGFHRSKRYSVVKVNIGDYRDINRVFQRGNEPDVLNGRYRCTDYLAARRFKLLSLPYRAFYVPGGNVQHRLNVDFTVSEQQTAYSYFFIAQLKPPLISLEISPNVTTSIRTISRPKPTRCTTPSISGLSGLRRIASITRNRNRQPSSAGMGSRLKTPTLIVINAKR